MSAIKSSEVIIAQKLKRFKGRTVVVDVAINHGIESITVQDVSDTDNRFATPNTIERNNLIMTYLKKEADIRKCT